MKKLLIILAGVLVLVVVFAVLYGDQVYQTMVTKPRLATDSTLTLAPIPLDMADGTNVVVSTQLSQWGYSVTAPWTKIDTEKVMRNRRGEECVRRVEFSSGQRVVLFRPHAWPDLLDSLLAPDENGGDRRVRALFAGVEYHEFYDRLMAVKPSDFAPFASKRRTAEVKSLLILKGGLLGEYSVVHSFSVGPYKGYQLGDPATDRYCHIIIFEGTNAPFQIRVGPLEERQGPVSQADICTIISSFRKVET